VGLFDADSALSEMYETCEELGVPYLISLPKNDRLLKLGALVEITTRRILVRLPSGHPDRHLLETLMALVGKTAAK
jgi:hypothetical protein